MVVAFSKKENKVQELASVKHAKKRFSAKKNHENFAVVVHAPQSTQYLVISWCFL